MMRALLSALLFFSLLAGLTAMPGCPAVDAAAMGAASPPAAAAVAAGAASTSAKSQGPQGGNGRPRGGEATIGRYASIMENKWIHFFADRSEMTVEDARRWVDPVTNLVNEKLITRFLTWIGEAALDGLTETRQVKGRAVKYKFTSNLYTTALKAAAMHLNKELANLDIAKKTKGFITSLPGIGELVTRIRDREVQADNDDFVDLQAEIREQKIDPKKNLEGFSLLWGFDPKLNLPPIPRLSLHVTRTLTEALAARGEDTRFHHLASMFTKKLPGVGPTRAGAVALCFVTNQGKVNRSGRRTYTGGLAHYNPLMDFVAPIGLDYVYRWQVLKEKSPDFDDFRTMFAAKLCRSSQSHSHSASYESQLEAFTALWKCLDVTPQEKKHYGRGAAHVNLDERNVLPEFVDRLANRLHDAKHSSYALNLPRDALLGSAAFPGDVKNHACYNPPHTSVEISDDAIFELLPWLRAERAKLDAALRAAEGLSFEEKKKARLFCLQGGYDAIVFVVSTLIQVAAARPRDACGVIMATSKRMFELFPNNPVFQLAFFKSDIFSAICCQVQAAEDFEIQGLVEDAAMGGLHMSPIASRLEAVVGPRLEAASSRIGQVQQDISLLVQGQRQLRQALTDGTFGGHHSYFRQRHCRYCCDAGPEQEPSDVQGTATRLCSNQSRRGADGHDGNEAAPQRYFFLEGVQRRDQRHIVAEGSRGRWEEMAFLEWGETAVERPDEACECHREHQGRDRSGHLSAPRPPRQVP